jgi:hypothetical protein
MLAHIIMSNVLTQQCRGGRRILLLVALEELAVA